MTRNDYAARVQVDVRRQRRTLGSRSPEAFAQIYLASHCALPFSRMHRELFTALTELISKRDGRLAVAAPRGHAKSTIVSLAFILWCVLYEKEKLIILVSATQQQVILLLKAIKDEIRRGTRFAGASVFLLGV